MTQDEIIEMAQQCGLIGMRPHLDGIYSEALETFAKLVAAKEREACAELAKSRFGLIGRALSLAIRARGEA
jgi:hypothetical protein